MRKLGIVLVILVLVNATDDQARAQLEPLGPKLLKTL
jgi:hypothetical protein